MLTTIIKRIRQLDRNFVLFLAVSACLGIAQSIEGSAINNFFKDKLHVLIMQRSMLEFPRELPGFLVFLVIGLLSTLNDVRINAIATVLSACGMLLLGVIPASYSVAIIFLFIYSMGQHLNMPLSNSIGMSFATDEKIGRKLGYISAANTATLVLGSAVFLILFRVYQIGYSVAFITGAVALSVATILLLNMEPVKSKPRKQGIVYRKEYRLFYWLSILFGARKQIFITFGPWVLVDVFKQPLTTMTLLFFITAVAGIFIKPLIGYLTDRLGERVVLTTEAGIFFFICLGYAFAGDIFRSPMALLVICICYIIDQSLTAVAISRATYVRRIALCKEDISPTLALGVSIDHIVSMFLPMLGGWIWYCFGAVGYKYVFLGGAVIAILNFYSSLKIKVNRQSELLKDQNLFRNGTPSIKEG